MSNPAADDFLNGGGAGKSFKFEPVGAWVQGEVVDEPVVVDKTDPATREVQRWPNNDPKQQLRVKLQTTLREDGEDDGIRFVYLDGSLKPESASKAAAVKAAIAEAGAPGLRPGGLLTLMYTGDGPKSNAALSAPKLYRAKYAPPAPAADPFLGGTAPATAAPAVPGSFPPAPAPAAVQQAPAPATPPLPGLAPTPAAPAAGGPPDPGQVQQAVGYIAAGVPDASILTLCPTLTPAILAALRNRSEQPAGQSAAPPF